MVKQGWILAQQGAVQEGIARMHQGLSTWRTMAGELGLPGNLARLAEAYGKAGRAEEGLHILAEALAAKEGLTPAAVKARWEAAIPMQRLGEPREFAALAAFLVSERASYITGSSIAVDGGWIRSLL